MLDIGKTVKSVRRAFKENDDEVVLIVDKFQTSKKACNQMRCIQIRFIQIKLKGEIRRSDKLFSYDQL